jgi:hypothetical protein
MANQEHNLGDAFDSLKAYLGSALTLRISALENNFRGACDRSVEGLLKNQQLTRRLFDQALLIKREIGQLHVVIHALGVLLSLPAVLEKGEVIDRLSLGAGNAPDRRYDLETNIRIAEFTFIDWKGRDSARQDKLFKDFFLLAQAETSKRRCLYVNSKSHAIKCLEGERACKSLLGRNANIGRRFAATYPATMRACDYFRQKGSVVDIIELHTLQVLDVNSDVTTLSQT